MVYVFVFILGSLLAYVSFMAGSMHGYDKGFEDYQKIIDDVYGKDRLKLLNEYIENQEDDNERG